MLTHRERLLTTLRFERPDRVAMLGGWIIDDRHQQAIAGCSPDEYWQAPERYAIAAECSLGVDAIIMVCTPPRSGAYRGDLDKEQFESYKRSFKCPEDVLAYVRSQSDPVETAR